MYAASLNLDIFFRKVFSDENIAKDYLQRFLGVIIEEIKLLRVKHKLTNSATIVEFDFRCKINGQYIIIEMQQSYKPDVVKRFYIYHALNSGLQLEGLPKKVSVNQQTGEETETLSYAGVLPVYTLIWMVDDNLGFDVETITFALSPDQTVDFIKNNDLWASKDVEKICAVREEILTLLQNKSKGLDFLPQNKLTFAFQKNIVKSKKFQAYKEWFEFAEATRNKKNTKKDFDKFSKNKTLMLVLERIKTDTLNVEELDYLSSWRELDEERGEVAEAKERVAQEREEVAKELQPS